MKVFLLVFIVIFSPSVFSEGTSVHSGKVGQIVAFPEDYSAYDYNKEGMLAIYIEGLPKGCGNSAGHRRVIMSVNHPLHDSVLSLALTAKATGADVMVTYFATCTHRPGSWDLAAFVVN